MYKALDLEMKHGREFVIIGLAAKQSKVALILKDKLPENHVEVSTIMVTIQLRRMMNAYKIFKHSTA